MNIVSGQKTTAVALLLLCLLTAAIYLPSLSSGIYMDDYYNLHLLEKVRDGGYAPYIFSGIAGPTGRPLSMLTFALQHESWPGNVTAFKAVNLIIHLLIGLLIFAVIRAATGSPGTVPGAPPLIALATAGLWMLHPMNVSTVLYMIQRMTQLSALFVLLGVWGYLHGRILSKDHVARGYTLMSMSVVVGTLLAVLCKENGALLPLLILVMDVTLLQGWPAPQRYARWRLLFLILPGVAVGLYLLRIALHGGTGFAGRPYSMYQKTLTEASVLIQYLQDLVLPHAGAYGLYHDDFPVARGLLDPPFTLVAVLVVVASISAALLLRRRAPAPAFGLLWFFSGHVLESTHLDLAIYFEHRNYLPAIGICFLLTWACAAAVRRFPRKGLILAAAALYAALFVWSGFATAALWRDPMLMAQEAVRIHPGSPAALLTLGSRLLGAGEVDNAMRLFESMEVQFPREIYPALKQAIVAACVQDRTTPDSRWSEMQEKAVHAPPSAFEILAELDTVIYAISNGECSALDQPGLLRLMENLAENPAYRRERGGLLQLAANLHMERMEINEAHADLTAAVRASPTIERQLQLLGLQLAMKQTFEAEQTLAGLDRHLKANPLVGLAYEDELRRFRVRLQTLKQEE